MSSLSVPRITPQTTEKWQQSWVDEYSCDMPSCVPYPRVPLSELLERAARRVPDRAACTLYGRSTSYAVLADQSRRLARALADKGAGPGRHIGVLLPNIPEYLVALQAIWLTGATALQLSPLMVAEEVGHWLEATGCHMVITLDLLAPAVMGALRHGPLEHVILTSLARRMAMWRGMLYRIERLRRNGYLRMPNDLHRHRFAELLQTPPLEAPVPVTPEEDVAVLAPTGGTTSSPKAVMLTHRNLVANALQLRNWCGGADGTESLLGVLPFFHAYGLTVSLLTSWAKCDTLHLYPRFETRAVLNLIETQRPELVPAVPAMLAALNNLMRGKPHDLSFIRFVISGASALEASVRGEFAKHGVGAIVEGYGLTEASPVTHANPPGPANRPGTIGRPLPDTEARLVDPDTGKDVGDGEVGELVVRGPQIMKGYFNNPLATEAVLQGGYLVFPAEVEEVLRGFPDVAEAAVVGVADHDRGEVVKALLVPRSGVKIDLAALENHCKLHLGKQKRPRQVEIVSELPKNFLGKVLRRKLRESPPAVSSNGQIGS